MRAAFVAVAAGKQVAILVPTTLLAEQHFGNFSDRFSSLPVKIAELSRFRSPKEVAKSLEGPRRRAHRHRDRHPQADPEGRQVQEPRARHHRRGAPLRRAPEGGAEAPARRGGRAHAHRHADPAHARDVARGAARLLGDRHRAAAAPRDQDLREPRYSQRHRARGGAARAEARRPGLLPLQRGRDDREHASEELRSAAARGAHRGRARPDARARAGARDARLLPPALQRAAVLDHHRDRHRRADRQHHPHPPRRPLRPRAAAPAARARRPLAPPGLRLPAHAARGGAHRAARRSASRRSR